MNSFESEFDLIRYIKERADSLFPQESSEIIGIGDDGAVLKGFDGFEAISTDMLVEGVDFDLSWADPNDLGTKALEVSLSDIAAMGSRPAYSMLSLAIPKRLLEGEFLSSFIDGYLLSAKRAGVRLIGGDISGIDGPFIIESTVIGRSTNPPILRSGARDGDVIFVSGELGGAAAGLELLKSDNTKVTSARNLIERQLRPEARIELGAILGSAGIVTSMIDVSDGFIGDLHHILESSGVGAEIDLDSLPVQDGIAELIRLGELTGEFLKTANPETGLDKWFALMGGEDFELIFTVAKEKESIVTELLKGHKFSKVGTLDSNKGAVVARTSGKSLTLPKSSFIHF